MFFLGSTIIALPHRAWGAELSEDYRKGVALPQLESFRTRRIDDGGHRSDGCRNHC